MPLPSTKALNVPQALAQALALHQQGRLADAEPLYAAILAVRPDHFDALHMLGIIKLSRGLLGDALRLIASAMRLRTPTPQILMNYGIVLSALNRHEEALTSFDSAIRHKSKYAEAHNSRGTVLAALGRNDEALESCRKALAIKPNYPEAHYNLGNSLDALGRCEEAVKSYDRALALRPDLVEALSNRGGTLRQLKRLDEALASCDRALALRPDLAEALSNRSMILHDMKRDDEALVSCDQALAVRPDYVEALSNRGAILNELKRYDEALQSYDRALVLRPNHAEALYNRGNCLHELHRYDEALESYDRALAVRPDDARTFNNRGKVLKELTRYDEALASNDRALALEPDNITAHRNAASLRLVTGDFSRGWPEYEWRWKKEAMALAKRNFPQPLWLGEQAIGDKTILLHSEQGFGDTIQFCRYVPLVAARGARVILDVQRPLQGLMGSLAGAPQIIATGDPLPDFDLHCPLLSLPLAFKTRLETIPSGAPYLLAPSQAVMDWDRRIGAERRPRIGLAWSGNAVHERDRDRSMSLRAFLSILDIEATFVSLQKDVRADDATVLDERGDILRLGDQLGDFSDTAALISQLDLVISVDTSVAHLAGALGKPVWVLLSYIPEWRWLLDRGDSPWYPTARLFRQNHTRTWDTVIIRVRAALLHLIEGLHAGRISGAQSAI
jgi:tetratricopeptide (TPR) repeat protein